MGYRLGFDVGGTFTDFALQDEASGELFVWKELTTPGNPAEAILAGLRGLLVLAGAGAGRMTQAVHGTTLASNVLLERKGQPTGLITTAGFRDVLEIGRQKRYEMYDLHIDKPVPLVPRALITEVEERMAYDGSVLAPLSEDSARRAIQILVDKGVQSIGVCLLHSYANPSHERLIARLAEEEFPGLAVSLSSEVCPTYREYERTSTTTVNAYIMPTVRSYLGSLEESLRFRGFDGRLYVMQSTGGITSPAITTRHPVRMLESGPAAGATMAAAYGAITGHPNLISFDMGGTTAKLCLIEDGQPSTCPEFEVDRINARPLSGLPVNVPALDVVEIGSGGGSIARARMGIIQVGPDSAGADPGPICYGRGGRQPTVTDANLVLGYLNPDYFLGGKMPLDLEAAQKGIEEHVARPLGIDAVQAAWGIHEMVTAGMARATRVISVERGRDPRLFSLIAFGGAGPMHGIRLARAVGARTVIVPALAGVYSAVGLIVAGARFDVGRTFVTRVEEASLPQIESTYRDLEQAGEEMVRRTGLPGPYQLVRTAEMRYVGQGHEIEVPVPSRLAGRDDLQALLAAFDAAYARAYGYHEAREPVEGVNWKVSASCPVPRVAFQRREEDGRDPAVAIKGRRKAYFGEIGSFMEECPVYDRYLLPAGATLDGPAIIEESESTTVVPPDCSVAVDPYGNLIATVY